MAYNEDYFMVDFYDFLTSEVCSKETVNCVTSINGWNVQSFYDILYYFTGNRTLEQVSDDYISISSEMLTYEELVGLA